jgi:hypothetical protein
MADNMLLKKLLVKPGNRVLVLNPPPGWLEGGLGAPPERVEVTGQAGGGGFDVVHLFVRDGGELRRFALEAVAALRPGGILWVSYPKRSSKVDTDLTRDRGWDRLDAAGWQAVTQVSVDATWSALRFRPKAEVGR